MQVTVLNLTMALPAEEVTLESALGRVLAAPVVARDPLPPFPASIMVRFLMRSLHAAYIPYIL